MSDGATAASRRDKVLGGVRARLAQAGGQVEAGRRAEVAKRLAGQPRHLVPERAQRDAAALKALFGELLTAVNATVLDAAVPGDVPGVIAGYLRSQNLPLTLRAGSDAWLGGLDWSREPALEVRSGRAEPADEVGLTHAVGAIAESGTLVLASGPDNPVTLNFLPETSVIVVRAEDLAGPFETAFERVRATFGRGAMPRTLNLISGPSRTADVGGRLVTGAHGPRRLCVIVVGGSGSGS